MANISASGSLPNLILIGAMKTGTTSLHYYLNLHPAISMSRQKELDFFIEAKNWPKGVQWYRSNFTEQSAIRGESSPNYTAYPKWQGIPQRMFSLIPEAKLIYVVRDPIERLISQYLHRYTDGKELRSLEDALAEPENSPYVQRSRYFLQLQQYLEVFPASNILVLVSEDLLKLPQATMKKVFKFLEVDDDFEFKFNPKNAAELLRFGPAILSSKFKFNTKLHQSSSKSYKGVKNTNPIVRNLVKMTKVLPPEIGSHAEKIIYLPFQQKIERPSISPSSRNALLDYLAEDINSLKSFTGYSFEAWNLDSKSGSQP